MQIKRACKQREKTYVTKKELKNQLTEIEKTTSWN